LNLPKVEPKESAESAFLDLRLKNPELHIAFVDINGLKLVNDVYGHAQGDLLIHSLAMTFSETLAPEERVFRFGGDEFLVLLNKRSRVGFLLLAVELERKMQEMAGTSVATLAVGIVKESSYANFDEIVIGADALMYEAKLSNRPIYREDKVTYESIRKRDPKALFLRDYFTSILKNVLQSNPELKDKKGIMEDVRAFWKAYEKDSFQNLSPLDLITKLEKHLPIERKTSHAS
jgi:diguanylate cyclase (GGDEF)-like protein